MLTKQLLIVRYPQETLQEAIQRVEGGEMRKDVAQSMGVHRQTVSRWAYHLRKRSFPLGLREEARRRVHSGESRTDVASGLGVEYGTVCSWVRGIEGRKGNFGLRGRTLELMKELAETGYLFCWENGSSLSSVRTIRQYMPVRLVKAHGKSVCVLKGREREAMEAFLKRLGRRVMDAREVATLKGAFGANRERVNRLCPISRLYKY